jgi:hypothetical protein
MKIRARVWVIAIGFLICAGLIVDVWFPSGLGVISAGRLSTSPPYREAARRWLSKELR